LATNRNRIFACLAALKHHAFRALQSAVARFRSREAIFRGIYHSNAWGSAESKSGVGSTLENTQALRAALPPLMQELGVTSLLDVPCGDFNWMRYTDLGHVSYIGGDIIDEIVTSNQQRHAQPGREFRKIDILASDLPRCDLIMVRDLFNHFPTKEVLACLRRINATGFKFLLVGHYGNVTSNADTHMGGSRPINFRLPPFSFPEPVRTILEDYEPHRELGRSMTLWRLPIPGRDPGGFSVDPT